MKILHISNYYYPHIGGIEQVARDFANSIKDAEQKVFCFNHEKGDKKDVVDGVEIIRAGCFAKVSSQSLSFSYGKLLKKTFKEFEPDTVVFHFPNPFGSHYLLKLLKKRTGCKLIVYYHLDITKQKILGKLFAGQTRRLLSRATKILATSPVYAEHSKVLRNFKDKCEVLPLCVNPERVSYGEEEEKLAAEIRAKDSGKIIIFAVGRHVPYKGMEYLVRASKLLDDGYKIYIGGKGPLTDSLKRLAEGDSKIEFTGVINDSALKAHFLAADIFCFPSITKNEAFGIALAEAMSFSKPAVTFTIEGSGVNYVNLNGVTGMEVENGNVEAYAEAVKALAESGELREKYGKAAKARVDELFSAERFAENVRNLIKTI